MDFIPKSDVVSSLPLQMALFFNAHFSPFWVIIHILSLAIKYKALNITYQVILVAIHIVAVLVEVTRLYLGFVGNLMERIPELSGFWITTLILQFPVTLFLLANPEIYSLPIERAVDIVQISFICFEIISGLAAVRRVANHQVTKFQQQVLDKDEKID
uniref:Transmembrane protein 17 n=1 Tax=Plectus sambesii TaxID=2011161 RepID=A0A914W3K1_9BILA